MSLRQLHRHAVHSLAPGELSADQYSELSKSAKKAYRKRAKNLGFRSIWEELYTENDLRSQQLNR